jgi:hypothetical protein
LFQLLLVGRLIAPGGTALNDGAPPCPFSLLGSASKEPADLAQIKQVVEVFNKLIRRYKYLQKDFEETSLPTILQHVNKYDAGFSNGAAGGASTPVTKAATLPIPDSIATEASAPPSRSGTPTAGISVVSRPNQDKLAMATACFVTQGLVTPAILQAIRRDHLVKDGSAIAFLTVYLKAFLANDTLDLLTASLRKGGVSDLLEFFPANRRTFPELAAHFKAAKLDVVLDAYQKQRGGEIARETLSHLKEMVTGTESSNEEVRRAKSLVSRFRRAIDRRLPEAAGKIQGDRRGRLHIPHLERRCVCCRPHRGRRYS